MCGPKSIGFGTRSRRANEPSEAYTLAHVIGPSDVLDGGTRLGSGPLPAVSPALLDASTKRPGCQAVPPNASIDQRTRHSQQSPRALSAVRPRGRRDPGLHGPGGCGAARAARAGPAPTPPPVDAHAPGRGRRGAALRAHARGASTPGEHDPGREGGGGVTTNPAGGRQAARALPSVRRAGGQPAPCGSRRRSVTGVQTTAPMAVLPPAAGLRISRRTRR